MSDSTTTTTPPKTPPKPMSKKERHARFLGIKRLYREKLTKKYALNSPEYRQARMMMRVFDRIGADDLEPFLSFLGMRIAKSSIQMWTDVQKVDILLNNLEKYRDISKKK